MLVSLKFTWSFQAAVWAHPGYRGQFFPAQRSVNISVISSTVDSWISFTPAILGKASLCVIHSCLTFMFTWEKAMVKCSEISRAELVDWTSCGCEDGKEKKKRCFRNQMSRPQHWSPVVFLFQPWIFFSLSMLEPSWDHSPILVMITTYVTF